MTEERESAYNRRRADEGVERRMDRLSVKVDNLDSKVDALSIRVAVIGVVIAAVTLVANIVGPIIAVRFLNGL